MHAHTHSQMLSRTCPSRLNSLRTTSTAAATAGRVQGQELVRLAKGRLRALAGAQAWGLSHTALATMKGACQETLSRSRTATQEAKQVGCIRTATQEVKQVGCASLSLASTSSLWSCVAKLHGKKDVRCVKEIKCSA